MENDKEIIIKKYLRGFEPVTYSGEFSGRIVVKTSEDIIRELEDIVELETNDVVAVMLAEGYDLMRRNEVFGWGLVAKRLENVECGKFKASQRGESECLMWKV